MFNILAGAAPANVVVAHGPGMMAGGWGFMPFFGALFGFLFFILIVSLIVRLIVRLIVGHRRVGPPWMRGNGAYGYGPCGPEAFTQGTRGDASTPTSPAGSASGENAEAVLATRFARGEIDEPEYRARLSVLKES